eukprot:CAMPEP_0170557470 /NCGR_PEP_ID=MMETSP0211-20121228/26289_1 /TAXON_ID=311385 /ORGANISM="Pseudokeronopsis sp., Strain OXSARD2" /LENGTH=73 /DNA_ID=CAMNT_0010868539 /DNA_START=432 /DNA_END=653 /DNA_ORIENTATION=-
MSKAGQVAMIKALAEELIPRSIRVNAIAPGLVETDLSVGAFGAETLEQYRGPQTRHFLGEADDIANFAATICS